MKFPWKVARKIETPSDQKLQQLRDILFPDLILREKVEEDGSTVKYHVDYSADSNLDAALIDLQEGYNDPPTQATINSVITKLGKARRILDAFANLDPDAKFIIVDNDQEETNKLRSQI